MNRCVLTSLVLASLTAGTAALRGAGPRPPSSGCRPRRARRRARPPTAPASTCPEYYRATALMRNDARLADWPALGRYREADRATSGSGGRRTQAGACSWAIRSPMRGSSSGGFFPGSIMSNRGIGGQTTPQMLIRLRPDVLALSRR